MWRQQCLDPGLLVLSGVAELLYKATDYCAADYERGILWNDPALAIAWPLTGAPVLSAKDAQNAPLGDGEVASSA